MTEELELWDTRDSLTRIRDFAHARRCNPLAVLGVAMGRVVAATDPNLVLPAITGGQASLNLLIGLVGRSGQGKGASHAAGTTAVQIADDAPTDSLGSGEGLARIFHIDADEQQVTRRAYLVAPEVDRISAIGSRQGSTLMPTLRQLWSGEALGFANAGKATRTRVPAGSYRAVVEIGVQPEAAGPLLTDTKGTAQRMLWLPVAGVEMVDAAEPEPWTVTLPNDLRREILVPEAARNAILDHRRAMLAAPLVGDLGDLDPLAGHKMLTQLKVAAGFMLLDNRHDEITEADWHLAGALVAESDRVRQMLTAEATAVARRANRAKAHAAAERDEVVADRKLARAKAAVLRWLERHEELSMNELRKRARSDWRDQVSAAVAELVDDGALIEIEVERGHRYRMAEGVHGGQGSTVDIPRSNGVDPRSTVDSQPPALDLLNRMQEGR